jgi:hypothetical protein
MSKYEPLTAFLKAKAGREVRMSFAEIETVLGRTLPEKSKSIRAWWSNNPSNNVMTKAWLAAGYKTAQVDLAGEKLSFVPNAKLEGFGEMKQSELKPEEKQVSPPTPDAQDEAPTRHPAFGVWKGKVTLLPDYDYTQPADPDWGKVYDD